MKFNRSCSAQFHEFFEITLIFLPLFLIFRNFEQMKPLKFFEQLGSVEKFRNMINVGRGAISYVNLEQDDPPSKRPACLFVSSLTSSSYTSSQVSKFSCKRRIVYFSFLLLYVFKINASCISSDLFKNENVAPFSKRSITLRTDEIFLIRMQFLQLFEESILKHFW